MPTSSTPPLPCVVGGSIKGLSTIPGRTYQGAETSSLNGYPYEFTVTINLIAITNSDQGGFGGTQFDATSISVGQWVLINNGCAYLIVGITEITNINTIKLVIRDVDMYNALSDPSQQGGNYPSENNPLLIFSVSDNGTPILTSSTTLGLIGTWLNDALGRFSYRNFVESYYNFDINNSTIDYSGYSVGQIVYIGRTASNAPYCFLPIDPTNSTHVAKAFGTVSSVNQPELSNIYVRPYGKLVSTLPFALPGNIGDVLYYSSSNSPSFCTNVAPATNAIPQYIKISSNVASVLYGTIGSTGGGGGGGFPVQTGSNGSYYNLDYSLIPTTSNIEIGSLQKPIRHLYVSENTLEFVGRSSNGSLVSTALSMDPESGNITIRAINTASNASSNAPPFTPTVGGNATYSDAWIQSNFIGAPPAITFGTVTGTSTGIYIPWTYPTQVPIGLVSSWVPVINSIASSLTYTTAGPTVQTVIPFSNGSNAFINYYDGSTYITGVVLSKQSGSNGVQSMLFPGESNARNAYVYYNPALSSMIASSNNTFRAWYKNTNPACNVSSAQLVLFVAAGAPSAVRSLATTTGVTTANVSYVAPLSNDITDATSLLTISSYTVSCGSTGSTLRFGGPIADATRTVQASNLSNAFTGLYPDAPYTFTVTATNSANLTGASNTITTSTSNLSAPPSLSNITFPANYYSHGTIVNVATGATKTALLNTSSAWTSSTFAVPIHSVDTRGSTASGIMSLSASLSNTTVVEGPSLSYFGFRSPQTLPSAPAVNNLTLVCTSSTDAYGTGSDPNAGFYLVSSNYLTIGSAALVPSSADYSVVVTQSNANPSSAVFTFQYDTVISTSPSLVMTANFASNLNAYVSGVRVVYGTPTYLVTSTLGNMGNYYYSSPLLTYTASPAAVSPSAEVNLSNITSGIAGGALGATLTCVSQLTSSNLGYSTDILITGVANNPYGSSGSFTATISAIADGPSYTLIYATLPQTLPSLVAGVAGLGFHVSSATAGVANVPPFNAGTPYSSTAYDKSANISTLQEVQVVNGSFTTPSAQTGSYQNYTTYYYNSNTANTVNYSGISATGYRFATFAWKLSTSRLYGGSLSFTLNGTSAITLVNGIAHAGATPILLFYRFEDVASSAPTNAGSISSAWINGNSTSGTQLVSGNYWLPSVYTTTPNWGLNSVMLNGSTATFDVGLYPINIASQDIRLYCRIGLPMAEAFKFSSVSARIT